MFDNGEPQQNHPTQNEDSEKEKDSLDTRPCIAIAGASGFLGSNALIKLSQNYRIKALCRSEPKTDHLQKESKIEWVKCDLFNLKSSEEAISGADFVLYLIHSMANGSRLTQSTFSDLDLVIADNIARACKKNNVKQIIYVGGILPNIKDDISEHLKSREEVEIVLGYSGIPVTSIRAGIIIGSGGSSFQIVYRLVNLLPILIAPKWTESLSQPVDIQNVMEFIEKCIGNKECFNQKIDVHGSEVITYNELMKRMAAILKLKRIFVTIPFMRIGLSKFWLYLITRIDYHTISPLVESLKHNLKAENSALYDKYIPHTIDLNTSLKNAAEGEKKNKKKPKKKLYLEEEKNVRSIQRLVLPEGWHAIDLAKEYILWLPKFMFALMDREINENIVQFKVFGIRLLTLTFSEDRSNPDRQLFYITGGFLVDKNYYANARLEFRISPHENSAIAAIHDYKPSLPWYLYRIFQANIHYYVMYRFNKHLKKIANKIQDLKSLYK